jgi:hypothetical protein
MEMQTGETKKVPWHKEENGNIEFNYLTKEDCNFGLIRHLDPGSPEQDTRSASYLPLIRTLPNRNSPIEAKLVIQEVIRYSAVFFSSHSLLLG